MDHLDEEPLKKLAIQENNDPELKKKEGFSAVFDYIAGHQHEFPETTKVLERAIAETQALADESEAYKWIKEEIQKKFKFGEPKASGDKLILPADQDQIIDLFRAFSDIGDRITLYEPRSLQGDISEYDDAFNGALQNSLEFHEFEDVNEGMKDILKPKDDDDIKKSFKNLPLYKQIEFLYETDLDIPEEDQPLIWKEKNKLKYDPKFDNYFRVTSTDPITYMRRPIDFEVITSGVSFKIYVRSVQDIPFVVVEQMNDEERLRVYAKNSNNQKGKLRYFKKAEEIFDWMMKSGYKQFTEVSEALQSVFKPKDVSNIKLTPTQLFNANWKKMGLKKEDLNVPLIFNLLEKSEDHWIMSTEDFDTFDKKRRSPWAAGYKGPDIGVHFFIRRKGKSFRIHQMNREDFAVVSVLNPDKTDPNPQRIYSFEELKAFIDNVVA
jgi:hypothetical protein